MRHEGGGVGRPATAEYEGKTYYFCSVDCKEEFEGDPQSYTD